MRVRNVALAALLFCGAITSASADVVLVFGQNGVTNNFSGAANLSQTQTALSAMHQSVTITGIQNIAGSVLAFFDFAAVSTSAATLMSGNIVQSYSGTFSFNSLANGTGTNYLSGTFSDSVFGNGTGLTLTASSATPGEFVTFASSVITSLGTPRAISLSFTNVNPPAAVCGTTLCSFTSSVSGNFSGSRTVPEPGSMGLAGLALMALGLSARRGRKLPKN